MRSLLAWSCSVALTAISLLGSLAPSASAQCVPDGLDGGPCCQPANATLPAFPAMTMQSTRFVCFDACMPAAQAQWCANFQAPIPMQGGGAFVCGAYDIPIRIRQCGLPITYWGGTLKAYYSRNWQASSVVGAVNLTVWRFIVNGDMKPTINLTNNSLYRPACQSTYGQVYFSGYIDYAFDCNTNQWQIAWNLNHECDGVHHVLGTARPAPASGFHPTRSFSFIGPGNTFSVSSVNPLISSGPIVQGAVRWNDWTSSPQICRYEEPAQGIFQPMNDFCMCVSTGAPQYNAAMVQANAACGSGIVPSPLGPLMQKRLGLWTNPNVYPGIQHLLFDFGFLDYIDGCTGIVTPQWFEGAETLRGYPAVDFNGLALGSQFEDLGSCNKPGSPTSQLIGAPHVVDYVLNFNLP